MYTDTSGWLEIGCMRSIAEHQASKTSSNRNNAVNYCTMPLDIQLCYCTWWVLPGHSLIFIHSWSGGLGTRLSSVHTKIYLHESAECNSFANLQGTAWDDMSYCQCIKAIGSEEAWKSGHLHASLPSNCCFNASVCKDWSCSQVM